MGILRTVFTVIFVLDALVLTIIVLLQEGKSAGLGSIAGGNSYWEQNKGRSVEGKKILWTKILAIAFIVLALILNLNVF